MSHYDLEQDYEEVDMTISYTISFNDGQDTVGLSVSHPGADDGEIEVELSDPALVAALHAACEKVVTGYFKAQDERTEHEKAAALAQAGAVDSKEG